jgi:D-glycero-D-manno-heptose 1,7-bisphosphate phosphatase
MRKLIVLDRDGVINYDSDDFIKSAEEWRPIDGSAEAIGRLTEAGYTIAVATNQSGIGRGLLSDADLAAIHRKMRRHAELAGGYIDKIVYCPHLPDADCACRKPRPGLLEQLATHYSVGMQGVPVIGDSERDLQAATAVGARPLLVLTGNGRKTQAALVAAGGPVEAYDDLASAVDAIVSETT